MKNKTYNPFKMVGSYFGAFLGFGILFLGMIIINEFGSRSLEIAYDFIAFLKYSIIFIIFGFILGYIIHLFSIYLQKGGRNSSQN